MLELTTITLTRQADALILTLQCHTTAEHMQIATLCKHERHIKPIVARAHMMQQRNEPYHAIRDRLLGYLAAIYPQHASA